MKFCLAILLISFISDAHGSRVKRGLSSDEQKKFLEELNKDRRKYAQQARVMFVPMKYDAGLEKQIVSGKSCSELSENGDILPLRINDVAEERRRILLDNGFDGEYYEYYFDPSHKTIACSKEAKCTELLNKENGPPELAGKTIEYRGLCKLGKQAEGLRRRVQYPTTPSPNKYADILGIPAISGAGSVFSLIISLFLVLYI